MLPEDLVRVKVIGKYHRPGRGAGLYSLGEILVVTRKQAQAGQGVLIEENEPIPASPPKETQRYEKFFPPKAKKEERGEEQGEEREDESHLKSSEIPGSPPPLPETSVEEDLRPTVLLRRESVEGRGVRYIKEDGSPAHIGRLGTKQEEEAQTRKANEAGFRLEVVDS